jgi:hypothetical protein
METGKGEWTTQEKEKLERMKSGERYYTWKEIAGKLGREEEDVKRTWARGLKERRIRELSVEYERIKWGVIAQVMGIDVDECVELASELELLR